MVHTVVTVQCPPGGSVTLVPSFPPWFQSWQCGEASLPTGRVAGLPEQSRKYSVHNTDQDTLYLGKLLSETCVHVQIRICFVLVVTWKLI